MPFRGKLGNFGATFGILVAKFAISTRYSKKILTWELSGTSLTTVRCVLTMPKQHRPVLFGRLEAVLISVNMQNDTVSGKGYRQVRDTGICFNSTKASHVHRVFFAQLTVRCSPAVAAPFE